MPAGTTMLPSIWAMQRDPKPEKFIPERWLPSNGKKGPVDVRKTVFGFGKRKCSGRHFAENTTFISIVSILAAFNIGKATNADGTLITLAVDYMGGVISHPKLFKCKLVLRSDKIAPIIQQAVESAKRILHHGTSASSALWGQR
ncbi:hypothetical protein M0805_001972 [Coniferiporia weirii]|nr:hypothetical protein M0805_001972 [Coniferiporia weirii]